MSVKDMKIGVESVRHGLIRAKALKDNVDTRLAAIEAAQFERGYD